MAANTKPTMLFFLFTFIALSNVQVFGQSNYASHGNNINYIGNGLPEETVLDGKVSDIELGVEKRHFRSRVGDNYGYFSERRLLVKFFFASRFLMPPVN